MRIRIAFAVLLLAACARKELPDAVKVSHVETATRHGSGSTAITPAPGNVFLIVHFVRSGNSPLHYDWLACVAHASGDDYRAKYVSESRGHSGTRGLFGIGTRRADPTTTEVVFDIPEGVVIRSVNVVQRMELPQAR